MILFIKDGDFNNKLYGQAARDAWLEELQTEPTFDEVFGTASTGSKVIRTPCQSHGWRLSTTMQMEHALTYDIYPTLRSSTKTLDAYL